MRVTSPSDFAAGLCARRATLLFPALSLLVPFVISAEPPPEPPISWTDSEITQILYPGARTEVTESFESAVFLEHVYLSVPASAQSWVKIEPSSFANVIPGKTYTFTATFFAPSVAPAPTRLRVLAKHADQREPNPQYEALPLTLQVDPSVKQDFSSLAQILEAPNFPADLEKLLAKFAPSQRQRAEEIMRKLDPAARHRQASLFRGAVLSYGTKDFQVYKGPWTEPDGQRIEVEFALSLQTDGQWRIISW